MESQELEQKIKAQLGRASVDKKHAWRYPVLATMGLKGPEQRTVVLRQWEAQAWTLRFYTDLRSTKVSQLQMNPKCALLFYDPRKHSQLRLKGEMVIDYQNELSNSFLEKLPEYALRDYQSSIAPGQSLNSNSTVYSVQTHFCLLSFHWDHLDYLELRPDKHRRFKAERGVNRHHWQEAQA